MNWPLVTLGDVCEFKYGKGLAASQRDGGKHAVYGSNGIVGAHSKAVTTGPTIVIGRKGSFGEVAYSPDACWPIDTTYYVDGMATQADLKWLSYRLRALGLTDLNRAAAVPGLNREDAYRQPLLLPPLDEQRRIAAILDHANGLQKMGQEATERTDELEHSVFADMFGASEPDSFERVGDVCDRVTVGVVVRPASYYVEEGIPALRTLNVKPGKISESDLVYFSESSNAGPLAKSQLRTGDVVISRTGRAGVAAIIPARLDGANAIDLIIVTPNVNRVDSQYFESLLNSPLGKRLVLGEQRGQIQQHFNIGSLKAAVLPFPSIERQRKYADAIQCVRATGTRLFEQSRQLDTLFTSLQSRAFSGQL